MADEPVWARTVREYVRDLDGYWDDARHADKLRRALAGASRRTRLEEAAVVDLALELAARRDPAVSAPVYVVGLGGSGSHWLAAMLAEIDGFARTREVYFPPRLATAIDRAPPDDAPRIVDAVHLLHALARRPRIEDESAVNNARGDPRRHRRWTPGCATVYLVRDPRDQVMSATFRKPEYRGYLSPTATDEAYLERNCERNLKVFRQFENSRQFIDHVCRYEALIADPEAALFALLHAIGRPASAPAIRAAVAARSPKAPSARERSAIPDPLREGLAARLRESIEGLGYPV